MKIERFKRLLTFDGAKIRDAMQAIESGAAEITLVVDDVGRLIGVLSDGDIRRALLLGASLDSNISQYVSHNIRVVREGTGRAEVLDMMRAYCIQQIPIVDESNKLVGLHLLQEILGAAERPNWAVIMAGGRGTRLDPITQKIPKPMLPVAGRPILERLVLHLVGYGFRRIFISVHYLGRMIEEHLRDGDAFGCKIEYLREQEPLGTCGSLSLLPERPEHPLLVMNGDLLTDANIGDLLTFHGNGRYAVTMGVRSYVHTVPFGLVEMQGDRIQGISEKPSFSWQVNAGVYVLEPRVAWNLARGKRCDMPAVIEQTLARGESIGAFLIEKDWIDVGHFDELKRAQGKGA
jgi:dTDP-glucose pyrophosphorylase